MIKKPFYNYFEDTGISICTIINGNKTFVGKATCHPDDSDMKNEKTGLYIAEQRALIKYLTDLKNSDIKPRLQALNTLYYSMNQSKRYNPKSYEAVMLKRQIRQVQNEFDEIKNMIKDTTESLNVYINEKDKFYKRIRANREKDSKRTKTYN